MEVSSKDKAASFSSWVLFMVLSSKGMKSVFRF